MAASIQEIVRKFKAGIASDIAFNALMLVLVAVGSFGLGRMSLGGLEPVSTPLQAAVVVTEAKQAPNATETPSTRPTSTRAAVNGASVSESAGAAEYVGSKNGSKFHLPTCPGASQIKEENKVYFASKEEAYSKGYTPAANCKGM